MLMKALVGTAKDLWQKRLMPTQVRAKDTRLAFAEIIVRGALLQVLGGSMGSESGTESLEGTMVPTGPILELMDVLAGSISLRASRGPVATISFDRVDMVKPVFHGDLCCGFRHDVPTGTFQHTHNAIITMVAINRFGRPRKGLPPLFDDEKAEHCLQMRELAKQRKELAYRWRKEQDDVDKMTFITKDAIHMPQDKEEYVPVSETEIEVRNWFLPRNLNINETLFGGDLLSWMRAHGHDRDEPRAVQAADFGLGRRDAEGARLERATYLSCFGCYSVMVCRRFRLEVEVEVFVDPADQSGTRKSHTGYFTVLNVDATGQYKPIHKGLLIDEANQTDMRALLKAQKRWEFEGEEKDLLSLPPLDISI
ncbi:hypothetical protein FI667_g10147, partial [Globisporangium splendens]